VKRDLSLFAVSSELCFSETKGMKRKMMMMMMKTRKMMKRKSSYLCQI
jgi:hypothetical protein